MDQKADLDAAQRFIVGHIEEQAKLSGEPLNEGQRLILKHLPSPRIPVWNVEAPRLLPRNIDYERLCTLGKAAYLHYRLANPTSLDWEFASAVFQLNHHPMWGLLQSAGVKYRKPLWDQLLLIFAALMLLVATVIPVFGSLFQWVGIGSIVVMLPLMYFASRRIEKGQLEKNIERYRLASRFFNATSG